MGEIFPFKEKSIYFWAKLWETDLKRCRCQQKSPAKHFLLFNLWKFSQSGFPTKQCDSLSREWIKVKFFLTNSEKFVFGEVIPQKVGNCLNKESILVRHGCWHFVLVNRLLTIHAYHYNRKLQPRGAVMDINQVKSGEFSAAQPISSHKYFSENQMDKHDKRLYKGRDFYFRDLLWPNAMCWMGI